MTVNIQSVNFKADGKLITFIKERLAKTTQFYDRAISTAVFLKVDNNHNRENKIVEMRMSVPGIDIVVTKERKSFEEAADIAVDVLIRQLKKRKEKKQKENSTVNYRYALILIEGLLVGGVTGIIGAGGGFLIIPALVILANIDMKVAIGTSLIIIAFKSLLGFFLGDALTMDIDWSFLSIFTGISLIGIFIGSYLGNFIDGSKLKKGFGYFIFIMAIFIFYMEFFVKQ